MNVSAYNRYAVCVWLTLSMQKPDMSVSVLPIPLEVMGSTQARQSCLANRSRNICRNHGSSNNLYRCLSITNTASSYTRLNVPTAIQILLSISQDSRKSNVEISKPTMRRTNALDRALGNGHQFRAHLSRSGTCGKQLRTTTLYIRTNHYLLILYIPA